MTALTRRSLLASTATAAAVTALAAPAVHAQGAKTLIMTIWANEAEEAAFRAATAAFEKAHSGVTVRLEITGSGAQYYQQIDTRLAGRQAPDVFRVQYQQIGRYASARALVDLGGHFDAEAFAPAFVQAVTYKGHVYAIPHHTDTFALYYNADMMRKIGAEIPASLDESWSWSQFIDVARRLKQDAGAPYGFACAWQNGTAYRWLPFLYQHGGQLLSNDFGKSQLSNPAGMETIAWTQAWFNDKLVPPGTSIKSNEQTQNLFANGTVGMLMGGDWQIPFLDKTMKADWGVTYMPRDVAMASDLGGNCLAVTRDTKDRALAIELVAFLGSETQMRDFITTAQFLPVRNDLIGQKIPYKLRPNAMQVFVEQATTIPPHLVGTVTLPISSKINAALQDQLDLAFTANQSPADTARAVDQQVQALLG